MRLAGVGFFVGVGVGVGRRRARHSPSVAVERADQSVRFDRMSTPAVLSTASPVGCDDGQAPTRAVVVDGGRCLGGASAGSAVVEHEGDAVLAGDRREIWAERHSDENDDDVAAPSRRSSTSSSRTASQHPGVVDPVAGRADQANFQPPEPPVFDAAHQ